MFYCLWARLSLANDSSKDLHGLSRFTSISAARVFVLRWLLAGMKPHAISAKEAMLNQK
jgi:hypothetical protein